MIQSRHLRSVFSFASFASHFFHLQEGLNIDQVLDRLLDVRKRHGVFLVCYMLLRLLDMCDMSLNITKPLQAAYESDSQD